MKNIILLTSSAFLIFGIFINESRAQSTTNLGLRSGLNFATINGEDVGTRMSFMAGAFLNIPIRNSSVSIQPEVLYSRKGFSNGDITIKLDYLEVPVLAKLRLGNTQRLQPHIYLGPFVGFNVNAESEGREVSLDAPSSAPPNVPVDDLDNQVRETAMGVVIGTGVTIQQLQLGVRYTASLTGTFEDGAGNGKNGVLSITAGVGF